MRENMHMKTDIIFQQEAEYEFETNFLSMLDLRKLLFMEEEVYVEWYEGANQDRWYWPDYLALHIPLDICIVP